MSTAVIDPYRLVTALKATGKSANFTADEIASAVDASQQGSDLLTKSAFDAAMIRFEAGFDAKLAGLDAKLGGLDAKLAGLEARTAGLEARTAGLEAKFAGLEARIAGLDAKFAGLEAKIELVRADLKVELRTTHVQTLMWLGGIMLASNGAVIAILARMARVI
jgi:chromosome segregation ATPase